MIPYDAKETQTCLICGETFFHNKQGRFTSHLILVHQNSLNDYLLSYYYTKADLKCSSHFCHNLVKLRRGVPNRYCSKSCGNTMDKVRECSICGKSFRNEDLRIKTCSELCGNKLRSFGVTEWHKQMPKEIKVKHFSVIGKNTALARKQNYKPAWNKGKTGIYTEETIFKIRQATIRQFHNQCFRKTRIERIMEGLLAELGFNYKYSFCLEHRQYDFVIPDHRVIIECDGDYWHANPKFYPNPKNWQLERIEIDRIKDEVAKRNNYRILRFWEDDIMHNIDQVRTTIASYVPFATT